MDSKVDVLKIKQNELSRLIKSKKDSIKGYEKAIIEKEEQVVKLERKRTLTEEKMKNIKEHRDQLKKDLVVYEKAIGASHGHLKEWIQRENKSISKLERDREEYVQQEKVYKEQKEYRKEDIVDIKEQIKVHERCIREIS